MVLIPVHVQNEIHVTLTSFQVLKLQNPGNVSSPFLNSPYAFFLHHNYPSLLTTCFFRCLYTWTLYCINSNEKTANFCCKFNQNLLKTGGKSQNTKGFKSQSKSDSDPYVPSLLSLHKRTQTHRTHVCCQH